MRSFMTGKKQDGVLRAILTIGLNRSLTVFSPIVLAESQVREGFSSKRFGGTASVYYHEPQ